MSGLAKYLEEEGLATTLVALVRKQAEQVRPPRALWVPFPLGRPFGAPGDAAFQTRVLKAMLALLERDSGPVLEDFPEDAPEALDHDGEGWVCPVRFAGSEGGSGGRLDAVLREIAELAPWYDISVARRGRTTVGASALKPEAMVRLLHDWAQGMRRENPLPDMHPADALRLASEDLKAFYFEAATARPGPDSSAAVAEWFWRETEAAAIIRALREACLADKDPAIHDVGDFMLVPEVYR